MAAGIKSDRTAQQVSVTWAQPGGLNWEDWAQKIGVSLRELEDAVNTKLGEAPRDGTTYGRKNGSWSAAGSGGGGGPVNWTDIAGKPTTFPPTLPIPESGVSGLIADLAVRITDAPVTGGPWGRQGATWVLVGGSSGSGTSTPIAIATTPPATPVDNMLWWESDSGLLHVRYNDGNSSQWVTIATPGPAGPQGPAGPPGGIGEAPTDGQIYGRKNTAWTPVVGGGGGGVTITVSPTAPTTPVDSQLWWESDTGLLMLYYNDGNTSQWVTCSTPGPAGPASTVPGPPGATGPVGADGQGVPTGGTAGQVLAKIDGTNYNTQWVNQTGGGGSGIVAISDTPPASPTDGQQWYESDSGAMFLRFNDGNTTQWIQTNGPGLTVPPNDDGEYVMINGVWRLKSQTLVLTGATKDVIIPAGARMVLARGHVLANAAGNNSFCFRVAVADTVTFLAGASDYWYSGFNHYASSATPTAVSNMAGAGASFGYLAFSNDTNTFVQVTDARIGLTRATASLNFHTQGTHTVYNTGAAIGYTDGQFRTQVIGSSAGSNLSVKALRFLLAAGASFDANSYVYLEWVY